MGRLANQLREALAVMREAKEALGEVKKAMEDVVNVQAPLQTPPGDRGAIPVSGDVYRSRSILQENADIQRFRSQAPGYIPKPFGNTGTGTGGGKERAYTEEFLQYLGEHCKLKTYSVGRVGASERTVSWWECPDGTKWPADPSAYKTGAQSTGGSTGRFAGLGLGEALRSNIENGGGDQQWRDSFFYNRSQNQFLHNFGINGGGPPGFGTVINNAGGSVSNPTAKNTGDTAKNTEKTNKSLESLNNSVKSGNNGTVQAIKQLGDRIVDTLNSAAPGSTSRDMRRRAQ